MAADLEALSVEQLGEQLKKSEAGRAKLRESLGLLREKALNTGELLRQHKDLQQRFKLTQEELSQQMVAWEEAAAEVQAAKQAAAMTNKGVKALEEQLRGCKAATKTAQKAAADAAALAAKTQKSQASGAADVAALQRQVAELQRRLQQPNATQHSTAAAADPAMPALRADLRQLQATLATLQQERRQSDSAAPELQQLRQQVAAQQGEMQRMAAEMARWRSAMGALAGPPAANTHHAAGADPWLAASPSEVMHDASVREGSNLLPSAAPLPRIGSSLPAAAQAARRGGGGWDAAPRAAAAAQREARPGATAAELAGRNGSDEGVSGDRRHRPSGTAAAAAAASANGLEEGTARRQRVLALVAPRAKRPRLDESAISDGSGSLSECTAGFLAGWEEGDTAAEVVQAALGRLTRCEEAGSLATADEVALALQEVVLAGAVPLTSVAAGLAEWLAAGVTSTILISQGFETALLECAAPLHRLESDDDDHPALLQGEAACTQTDPAGASMAGLAFMPVWCAPGARWPRTLALVLRCAAALSGCLQAALGGSGGGSADGSGGCDDDAAAALRADGCSGGSTDDADRGSFLEDLRAHLHRGASAQGGRGGSTHPRYYETEACAVCAAAMLLARMLGDVQAARVFVYDLLMTGRDGSTSVLPSLAAALDAWPEAIPALPPATGGGGGIEATECATVAALHTVLGKLCNDALAQTRSADNIPVLRAGQRLQALGSSTWSWEDEDRGQRCFRHAADAWAALRSAGAAAV